MNLAVIVTEPTLSGIHDLERVIGVCRHFDVPAMLCINKYDVNEMNSRRIETYCNSQSIEVAVKVPYDDVVTKALVQGLPVVEYDENDISKQIKVLWEAISTSLAKVGR